MYQKLLWSLQQYKLTILSLQAFQPHKSPILTSQLHQAQRSTVNLMSHPNLIFTNKWEIQQLLFFLSFRYFRAILYKPDFQQCWIMFTHSNHTILQVILYKLCSRTYLWAFQPYTLANSIITVKFSSRDIPKFGVTSLSYL